jgi:hypothetical protein
MNVAAMLVGSRWPKVALALALPGLAAGCAAHRGGPMGAAESAVPLRMPDLPPEVRLLGMEQDRLESLFGQPAVQRNEQQAQFWRYSLGRCQLDVFLYPDPKTGRREVAYYDVRPTGYEVGGGASGCAEVVRQLGPTTGGLPPAVTR